MAKKSEAEKRRDYWMERVPIRLMKDNYQYKDPLYVSVNDYTAYIPRGVEVEIPRYVAKAIEESTAQDESTAVLIANYEEEYAKRQREVL